MGNVRGTTIVWIAILLAACGPGESREEKATYKGFVSKDTANMMISSYLTSIGADSPSKAVPDLNSLIMDANELRTYLNRNRDITKVKLMFAHTMDYINEGNTGKHAGYRSDALTIVIAGFDNMGNYVYAPGNMVPDHCAPCPTFCPSEGTAAGNLLQ